MNSKEIIKQLNTLKKISPSHEWRKGNFVMFEKMAGEGHTRVSRFKYLKFFPIMKEFFNELPLQLAPLSVLVIIFIFGGGIMVNATHRSLPGNFLYPFKLNIEKAQIALTTNATGKTELKVEFSKNRVHEIDQIIRQSDTSEEAAEKVSVAAHTLKADIESVKENVKKSETASNAHFKIALSLASTTNELKDTIHNSQDIISDEVKDTLEEAADTAQEAGVTALIKSIETSPNDTTATSTDEELKVEAIHILKDTLFEIYEEAKISYRKFQDIAKAPSEVTANDSVAVKDIYSVIGKLYTETDESLDNGDYDKIVQNLNLMKDLIKKIDGMTAQYTEVKSQTSTDEADETGGRASTTQDVQ